MKKQVVIALVCTTLVVAWVAGARLSGFISQAAGTSPVETIAPTLTEVDTSVVDGASEMSPEITGQGGESTSPPEPGIPAIVDKLYLGVPAGNGYSPYNIAVDGERRRVYTLNYGIPAFDAGNTISVLDLETKEIIHLIRLENMEDEGSLAPNPLDLQVDPYRPRLYAVWEDRYAERPDSKLTIIDADTLQVVNTLPGVEALAVGPDRLYLANDTRLWSVDPDAWGELEARDLDPRKFNEPLLLNLQANRLYLGRGLPWSLEIFEADSLTPVGSYPLVDRLIRAAVDRDGRRLFILENEGDRVVLRAMDADGYPLADPAPVPLTDDVYGDLPMAFGGQTLYIAGGDYQDYRLDAFELPNLRALDSLSLPAKPYDLDVDPTTGLLYAAYNSWSDYILAVDPEAGSAEPIYTALTTSDALADPATDRLYILDDGGRLRVLSLADYSQVASLETGYNILNGYHTGYGQLSLDPGRERLYIGGDPVQVVDTERLQVTDRLDGRGQVTPDPAGDRLYLTPPCNCRMEQCNTLILSAETLTGTQTLFPPQDPFSAPCVVATRLDSENQLLYARIYNGVPGSNSGDYYTIFDVSDQPEELYTAFDISYGDVALDPRRGRAFAPRYRINRGFIHRFEAQGGSITQTLTLAGAAGQLAYDPEYDRLYAVQKEALQVFGGELTLLAEISLPGDFELLAFDRQGGRLYLGDANTDLLVVATGGGELAPPPPVSPPEQPQIGQLWAAPDSTLFRVYDQRLYRSDDGGGNWELLGRGLPGRPVGDLAISPEYEKDQTLLVGLWGFGFGGGLHRSTDGGDTWGPTTRGLTDLEISEIRFSPTYARDRTIFLTTLDRGLFRSGDGGDTWVSLADGYATDPYDLEIDHMALSPTFADDGLVIISKRHLLRSADGGESWTDTRIPGGLVAFSPDFANDGLILSGGRWRSTDGGQTWQPAAVGREPGVAQELIFSPSFSTDQTAHLLLRRGHEAGLGLQRSADAGHTWDSLLEGLPVDFKLISAALLPSGELHLTATDGQQVDVRPGDLTWGRRPADIAELDLQALAIQPDGTIFLANSEAGVFKSVDGGETWVETDFPARADGVLQAAHLALADDGTLLAAAGTALARSVDGGRSWTHLDGVPAGFEIASLAVSPNFGDDGVVVIGGNYHNNQILRSADRGNGWEMVFDARKVEVEYASDIAAIAFSPSFAVDGRVYAWLHDGGLLRSDDGGLSWDLAAESSYYVQALALSPGGERLYVGALNGHVLVSEDRGQSWLNLREQIPDDRTWSTALAFGAGEALFLGTEKGVYRSLDGGEAWARASAGLPLKLGGETPQGVRALRFQDGRVYAAMAQGGLFVSDDQGESWRGTVTGQPASPVGKQPTPTPGARTASDTVPPTLTPQPTPAPADCPTPPAHFAGLWAGRVAQLGCPTTSHRLPMAEQSFEGGRMFWRSDTRDIYVLPWGQPYVRFDDTWDGSQPAYSCPEAAPPQTPPTPQRGFGKVWCNQPLVRELLGNATSGERLVEVTLQEFDAGLIFGTDEGMTYILEARSNGWEQAE